MDFNDTLLAINVNFIILIIRKNANDIDDLKTSCHRYIDTDANVLTMNGFLNLLYEK